VVCRRRVAGLWTELEDAEWSIRRKTINLSLSRKRSMRGKTAKVCGARSCWVGGRVIGHWHLTGDRISEPANSCPTAFTIRVLDALPHSVHEIYDRLLASPSIVRCKTRARKQLALTSWGSGEANVWQVGSCWLTRLVPGPGGQEK
jgi:hypothetical protein